MSSEFIPATAVDDKTRNSRNPSISSDFSTRTAIDAQLQARNNRNPSVSSDLGIIPIKAQFRERGASSDGIRTSSSEFFRDRNHSTSSKFYHYSDLIFKKGEYIISPGNIAFPKPIVQRIDTSTTIDSDINNLAITPPVMIYPALLSVVAAEFRKHVVLSTHFKDGLEYQDCFVGREAVVKNAILFKYLFCISFHRIH